MTKAFHSSRHIVKQIALCIPPIRRLFAQRDQARHERDEARKTPDDPLSTPTHPDTANEPLACTHSVWPSEYYGARPQRYSDKRDTYLKRGGRVRFNEDVRGFLAGAPENQYDMARYFFFCLVLDQIIKEGLHGDVAELGVYKGNTATLIAHIARRIGSTAYLLDTFEGFSKSDLKDIDMNVRMSFDDTSINAVRALVGEDHVKYIKGYFPKSTSQMPDDKPFCLVHIDCDLYSPISSALEYFYPRVVPGGFIIIHDYSSLHWDGAEKAVDEFFADKVESIVPLPDSAGSVVIRKARRQDHTDNWYVSQKRALMAKQDWLRPTEHNLARQYLGAGWSGAESWGVWGVGEKHTLHLYPPAQPTESLLLDIDAKAALLGKRTSQSITVSVAGHTLARWEFTLQQNQAVRTVTIPASIILKAISNTHLPAISVEFTPHCLKPCSALDPKCDDTRSLGLGLYAFRLRKAGTGDEITIPINSKDAPAAQGLTQEKKNNRSHL